ncbi:DUF6766 family protein [Arthrobacter crystallopoietes]|uniref:Uncharacterized protein n=1 Tax=Crystallibacter crystallopoietes TaxID=37928 RepID=A0A1H1D121_9MICC|nr:DUF6766 family protein [Arthrobacter crystallopoietes]AUI50512.1 hypothetical protein AC20117_06395 [Arthrobacter crystallopoietes]SDQ70100.1 hypothetical protein SAMN04489742_2202 [Arthrobacter crystallopoietes]
MKHNPFITNGLSIGFGLLFLFSLVGQAFSGLAYYNEQQVSSNLDEIGLLQYVTSSSFVADVAENWQSEYLQFTLLIVLAVWLVQKGSPESKEIEKRGQQSDKEQLVGQFAKPDSPKWAKAGGWRTAVFSNSLGLVMGAIFVASWLVQSVAGFSAYAENQLANLQDPGTWTEYLGSPEFWNRTLQNWQSEFLAVWSMVILSVYLRQRASPESKAVGMPHDKTGASN